ncbi:hypothetical protein COO60DRAFT_1499362 [Scenedesmus sp. NREL 46B-D3]|nr:hypothetical protein COO60DRAFT_1499362 [Scenedesmus sp. NREL 46B-D3]
MIVTLMSLALLLLGPTASTADAPGRTVAPLQDAGRRMLTAAALNPAVPTQAVPRPTAEPRLHQEHECPSGETWIRCRSQPLCDGIGRVAPSTQCGSVGLCAKVCHTARRKGGRCAELLDEPTQTYYYSIHYEGTVSCGPLGGQSGDLQGGRPRPPPGLPELQAAAPTAALPGAAAAAETASAGAVAAALQVQVAGTPAAPQRQLLQEHACHDDEFWIHCNSQPLCWGIGRSAPSTECGPAWLCESMCNTALQRGGVCNRQWNPPSGSYYFSIVYQGAVFCDPPRGGSNNRGSKRPRGLRQLQAATATLALPAATASAAQATVAAAAAASTQVRKLLQEHVCGDGEFWIHCNSQSLCSRFGRRAPSTACGPAWVCEAMCNAALQRNGVCHRLWNAPSQTYYYAIQHNGAVFCDPPGGGSGSRG